MSHRHSLANPTWPNCEKTLSDRGRHFPQDFTHFWMHGSVCPEEGWPWQPKIRLNITSTYSPVSDKRRLLYFRGSLVWEGGIGKNFFLPNRFSFEVSVLICGARLCHRTDPSSTGRGRTIHSDVRRLNAVISSEYLQQGTESIRKRK